MQPYHHVALPENLFNRLQTLARSKGQTIEALMQETLEETLEEEPLTSVAPSSHVIIKLPNPDHVLPPCCVPLFTKQRVNSFCHSSVMAYALTMLCNWHLLSMHIVRCNARGNLPSHLSLRMWSYMQLHVKSAWLSIILLAIPKSQDTSFVCIALVSLRNHIWGRVLGTIIDPFSVQMHFYGKEEYTYAC